MRKKGMRFVCGILLLDLTVLTGCGAFGGSDSAAQASAQIESEPVALPDSLSVTTEGTSLEETASVMESNAEEATYTIYVVDQNGDPVPEVYLNICTDTLCEPTQSDDQGQIVYKGEPDTYHLQILKVPEGYSFDASYEVYTEPTSGEITVEITKE